MLAKQKQVKTKCKSEFIDEEFLLKLNTIRQKLPLKKRKAEIPAEYIPIRKSLIDWLSEIRLKLKLHHITTIKASIIYDKVIVTFQHMLNQYDHHLLMIASLLIAIKYEEINQIDIDIICRHVAHGKFNKKQILACEMLILKRLNFILPKNEFIDFSHEVIDLLFNKCITAKDIKYKRLVEEFSILIYKMMLFDYEISNADCFQFYICVIFNSFKLFDTEPACNFEKNHYIIFEKNGINIKEVELIDYKIDQMIKKYIVNRSKSFIIKEFTSFVKINKS
jgi:hypothetical protein